MRDLGIVTQYGCAVEEDETFMRELMPLEEAISTRTLNMGKENDYVVEVSYCLMVWTICCLRV